MSDRFTDGLKPATGHPCVPALPSNSRRLGDASTGRLFVDYAALSNNRRISDQLRALGRKRIQFHGNRRLNAGVEHARLEQLTGFFQMQSLFPKMHARTGSHCVAA